MGISSFFEDAKAISLILDASLFTFDLYFHKIGFSLSNLTILITLMPSFAVVGSSVSLFSRD